MGSSSSKASRSLPKSQPSWAGARTARPPPPTHDASAADAYERAQASTSRMQYGGSGAASQPRGPHTPTAEDRRNHRVYSSEKKDDTIMRDGQDPHLLANLTKLGQVAVPKPGTPYEKTAPALRTLLSRSSDPSFTSTSALPPAGHTTSALLSDLFDKLKNTPPSQHGKVCQDFGLDLAKVQALRRWVNSPSIDKDKTVIKLSEEGEKSVQMTAVWVDSAPPEPAKAISGQ